MKILRYEEDINRMESIAKALYSSSPEAARKYRDKMHLRAWINQQTIHIN